MKKLDIIEFAQEVFFLESGKAIKLEDWQREKILKPVFHTVDDDGLRRYRTALVGMAKKNGKSTLASLVAAYMLIADGESDPEVYSAAYSRDQAKIIFNQTKKAFQRSPIIRSAVRIYKDAIELKDGSGIYKALSADAPGNHGLNAHCVLWDELWNQRNYDLWEALTHSPARRHPLHFVVSYAGYRQWAGDPLWDLYQRGLKGEDEDLYMMWLSGDDANPASWVNEKYLERQARNLPEHMFRRLHRNEFTSGAGAFLTKDDVEYAVNPALDYKPYGKGERYYMAVDLGLVKDKTVVTVLHKDRKTGKIILDAMKTFEGRRGEKLNVREVEAYILHCYEHFRSVKSISCDPWQMVSTVQRLRQRGLPIEEFVFGAQSITKLTENLFSLFKDRRIEIYDHPELIKELLSVKIIEKNYGFRIDHESGAHDDHVISLGMAALEANTGSSIVVTQEDFQNAALF